MTSHPQTSDWPEWQLIRGEQALLVQITEQYRLRDERCLTTVYPLLDSIRGSVDTLCTLCADHNVRDGYVISRVIYETVINACFIVAGGDDVAERAWRHARQKSLRDLDRSIEIAGKTAFQLRWSGADSVLSDPESQEVLAEFTSKSGREITAWTPESVRERLEHIVDHFGEEQTRGLIFGILLYRHASEIAHGTLYGSLFVIGGTDPRGFPRSKEALHEFRVDHARMLLMLIGFALECMLVGLATTINASELAASAIETRTAFSKRRRPDA